MKLSTILWPWGRMLELERELGEAAATTQKAVRELGRERIAREDAEARAGLFKRALDDVTAELRVAYFRNPKTGRMGRKGERFPNAT